MGSTDSRTHRRRLLALLGVGVAFVVALAVLAVSCSGGSGEDDDPVTSTTDASTASSQPSPPADPGDQVVWQERTVGGPDTEAAALVPRVTIYADGRIFLADRDPSARADHPVPVMAGQVAAAELDAFLAAAARSGLFAEGVDFGRPDLTDLATTTVSFHEAGVTRIVEVYALAPSFEEVLSAAQVDRRNGLRALVDDAAALAADADAEPWTPERIRVTDLGLVELDPEQALPLPWPGPDPATFAEVPGRDDRCLEVGGEEAARLYETAIDAPDITFRTGDGVHELVVAALLPTEVGCQT